MLTLIEKAQTNFDLEKTKDLEQKLLKDEFTLDDFLTQMQQIKKIGSLSRL